MSVTQFKGSFDEMARANRFEVSGFGLSNLTYMAKGASLPGLTLGVAEAWYKGRAVKLAGDATYPDWTITIYQNTRSDVYNDFKQWRADTLSHEPNIGHATHLAYKRDGEVRMLGRADEFIVGWKIVGAVPIELGALELASDSNDTPAEFTVTLAYDYVEEL